MRQDMSRVVLEIGRSKARTKGNAKVPRIYGEPLYTTREPMRPRSRHWASSKVQRLAHTPLYRFLRSRVGRSWDEVYSEAVNVLTGPRAQEMLNYLRNQVGLGTYVDGEGNVRIGTDYLGICDPATFYDFYVDPVSRLLTLGAAEPSLTRKREAWSKKRDDELLARRREVNDSTQLHCIDGLWYQVSLSAVPPLETPAPGHWINDLRRDAVLGVGVRWHPYRLEQAYGKAGVYAASKRQLSHKELAHFGLVN